MNNETVVLEVEVLEEVIAPGVLASD